MLIVGSVVAAFAVFNGVYPAVERSTQAVSTAADAVNDRMTSQVEIIQVSAAGSTVDAWVKNVGSGRIDGIDNSDVFFGLDGDVGRVAYGADGAPLPYWSYQLEGGNTQWGQAVTNRITIHLADGPAPGAYELKFVIPNGISDETVFSAE